METLLSQQNCILISGKENKLIWVVKSRRHQCDSGGATGVSFFNMMSLFSKIARPVWMSGWVNFIAGTMVCTSWGIISQSFEYHYSWMNGHWDKREEQQFPTLSGFMSFKEELKIKSQALIFSHKFLFRAELMPYDHWNRALSWCAPECHGMLAFALNIALHPFPHASRTQWTAVFSMSSMLYLLQIAVG